jgi:tight adherence protein C
MTDTIIILAIVGAVTAFAWRWTRRHASRVRLDAWLTTRDGAADDPRQRRGLPRWLELAGYWNADAAPWFVVAEALAVVVAGMAAWLLDVSGAIPRLAASVVGVPGGVGTMMAAVLSTAPWIVFVIVAALPVLHVRAARRRVVREVEADLPLVLEIFATLAEAGLGFDASLVRLLDAMPGARPLHRALRHFQRDVRSGVPRVQALRRTASRLDVSSVTVFVSAIVQAEHVGAGVAGTLRRQADDVRDRRRERVAILGQMLPVKLMFPLVACFLPGIFLTTLGPALLEMVEVTGGFMR